MYFIFKKGHNKLFSTACLKTFLIIFCLTDYINFNLKLLKMKKQINPNGIIISIILLSFTLVGRSGSVAPNIKEETVTYTADGMTLKGFLAFDDNIKGKRPAILVVHEWWGLNDYVKMRVRKLAELGYIAMAADMYGEGKIALNPTDAQTFATPYYKDPNLVKSRLDAAMKKLKEYSQADQSNMAAIGYCFGGFIVLNYAKLGADLKGVVSFHGGMGGVPVDKKLLKAKVLVCQGGSDKFVSIKEVEGFKHKLDSIDADNTLKVYANATHAFTNPDATKTGKQFNMPIEYNPDADRDSWNDMKIFFGKVFTK
jgi:dienelactone hydrolase